MRAVTLFRLSATAAGALVCLTPGAIASVPAYSLVGSFSIPSGTSAFDLLPDGRVMALVGSELRAQTSPGTSSFVKVGSVSPAHINAFGASFIRVSPSGSRIAIGDGNAGPSARVLLLGTGDLDPFTDSPVFTVNLQNFDAAWADDNSLFVSGASFGIDSTLSRVDALTLTASTVITAIGDGSGGVTIHDGRLFTGAGFDYTPGSGVETGDIRAFDLSLLSTPGPSIDFATSGIHVGRLLSGASLGFDSFGSLLVGGGDFFGEAGFAAVVDPDAVNAALAGGAPVSSASALTLAPDGPQYYSIRHNPLTSELFVNAFGSDLVYRYAVPSPGSGAVMVIVMALGSRRRRHAA